MKKIQFLCLAEIAFLMSSCDNFYTVEWKVANLSSDNIEVYSSLENESTLNFNSLSFKGEIVLISDLKTGKTSDEIDVISNAPLEILTIRNSQGDTIDRDLIDFNNWVTFVNGDDYIEYQIEVKDSDF